MAVNRYDIPSRVVQRPAPFLLPSQLMFQAIAGRQQQYDSLSTALSGLDQSYAGLSARYSRDQNYLNQKNAEVDNLITSLEGQDLTRVPNLKGKILSFASDPNLLTIKQNNEYYNKMRTSVTDLQKRNEFSDANYFPIQQSIDQYNSSDALPEFFPVDTPNAYWDWEKSAVEMGKLIEPSISSSLELQDNGMVGIRENSTITFEQARDAIYAGLGKRDLDQLKADYLLAAHNQGIAPTNEGYQNYVLREVGGKAGLFEMNQSKLSNLKEISDDAKTKANNYGGLGFGDGFMFYGPVKTQAVTFAGGFTLNNPLDPQIDERISNLTTAYNANEQALKQYVSAPNTESVEVDMFNTETGQFEKKMVPKAYKSVDEKDQAIYGEEVLGLLNEQQAIKQQKYYFEHNLKEAKEAAIKETLTKLRSEGRGVEAAKLESSVTNGELDLAGFRSEVNRAMSAEVSSMTKPGNSFYMEDGNIYLKSSGSSPVIYAKPGDAAYEKIKTRAENSVKKNSYAIKMYDDILQGQLKNEFAIKTMFMKGVAFTPEDKDYQALAGALDMSPDNFIFYDDATGEQFDQFGKHVLAKEKVGFVPRLMYYNPEVKQWMIQGGVVPLDDKGNKMLLHNEKGDLFHKSFSVSIESLDRDLLMQLYGNDAAQVSETANKRTVFEEAFKNSDGTIHIPISAGNEKATLYATKAADGSVYGSYYDPNLGKYITFSDKDTNDFSNRVVLYNMAQTQYTSNMKQAVKGEVESALSYQFNRLGINSDLANSMIQEISMMVGRESGYNPSIANKAGHPAGGLFQFYADKGQDYKTMGGKKYKISDLMAMSPTEQVAVWVNDFIGPKMGKLTSWQQKYGYGAFALYNLAPRIILNDYSPETPLHKVLEGTKEDVVEWVKDNPQYMGLTPEGLRQLEANGKLIDYAYSVTVDDIRKNILNK